MCSKLLLQPGVIIKFNTRYLKKAYELLKKFNAYAIISTDENETSVIFSLLKESKVDFRNLLSLLEKLKSTNMARNSVLSGEILLAISDIKKVNSIFRSHKKLKIKKLKKADYMDYYEFPTISSAKKTKIIEVRFNNLPVNELVSVLHRLQESVNISLVHPTRSDTKEIFEVLEIEKALIELNKKDNEDNDRNILHEELEESNNGKFLDYINGHIDLVFKEISPENIEKITNIIQSFLKTESIEKSLEIGIKPSEQYVILPIDTSSIENLLQMLEKLNNIAHHIKNGIIQISVSRIIEAVKIIQNFNIAAEIKITPSENPANNLVIYIKDNRNRFTINKLIHLIRQLESEAQIIPTGRMYENIPYPKWLCHF